MAYAKGENGAPGHQVKVAPSVIEGSPSGKTACGGESVCLPRILDKTARAVSFLYHRVPHLF